MATHVGMVFINDASIIDLHRLDVTHGPRLLDIWRGYIDRY